MKTALNILIVEDETDLREVFSEMLQMLGCTVTEACNGKQALEILQTRAFDAVFTDMQMPEMDGGSLIRAMTSLQLLKTPLIFIMTGCIDADPRAEMKPEIAEIVKSIISKPFSYKQISNLLETSFS